jgi:hypothetical protein
MRQYLLIIILLIFLVELNGQQNGENLTGQVSFVSTKNVYVKFKSTTGLSAGDTLFAKSNGNLTPVLVVDNLSSLSCVCSVIPPAKPAVADFVTARVKTAGSGTAKIAAETAIIAQPAQETHNTSATVKPKSGESKQHINGSIAVSSYSDFSDTPAANSQRYRYTLSLDAKNIANSKFTFESYASFRYKQGEWDVVKNDIFNALKIFDLALIYDPNKTTRISLGRKINPRLSNIGAADGLQIEKSFGGFSIGALAGTRPDYTDYGFNKDLLQFGGYLGYSTKKQNTFSESSVAFMQQMNGSNIDRRFLYFQHSNSLIKNLYFIGTFEVDLYQLKTDTVNKTETASTVFDPTGFYLSLRYRFTDKLSVSGSYDARKNVVYYETYKTFMDRILENEMRQGFRLQANYRITRDLIFGLQTGYRFVKSDPHPSRNIYSYITYSNIPGVKIAITVSGTYTESSYMSGKIYGANVSRDFFKNKLQTTLGYHYVDYTMPETDQKEIQNIGEINLYWQLPWKMAFGVNYEGTFEQQYKYHRIYLQLRKRF